MSWSRGSLLAALLVFSVSLASADTITVNTTTDDNAVNSLCSLREAVEYFNQSKPVAGYQGCEAVAGTTGNAGSTDIITLASDAAHPYLVSTPIYIHRNVTINGAAATGDARTIIKATASNRVFVFYDKPSFKAADCGLAVPATCSPAGAPVLSIASDTGVSNSDFLTSDNTPEFSATVDGPPSDVVVGPTTTVSGTDTIVTTTTTRNYILVRIYQSNAENTIPVVVQVASLEGDASSTGTHPTWTASTNILPMGDQSISYTTEGYSVITVKKKINGVDQPDAVAFGPTQVESAASPATAIRVYPAAINQALALNQLDIEGCAVTVSMDCSASVDVRRPLAGEYTDTATGLPYHYDVTGTAGKGGIIYATGDLALANMILHGGHASTGGAVYVGAEGALRVSSSQISDNAADHGAALYLARNALIVSQSLLTANTANASAATGAAVVEVSGLASGAAVIESSTLSGNTGMALSLQGGSTVNSSTIVLNTGGINFNNAAVSVYNSVVAGNPDNFPLAASATDCMNLPATLDFKFSVGLSGGGCGSAGLTLLFNDGVAGHESNKLMAALSANGRCTGYVPSVGVLSTFNGMGVLCPLADNGSTTKTHLIRLLPTYTSVSDSPLMTKGSSPSSTIAACSSTDQRNKPRHTPCDVGALELQPTTGVAVSGGVITYGQTYTADDYGLGDEELLDPSVSACPPQMLLADVTKKGCPWLERAPSRGTVTFNTDGTYTYKPNSDFHGFDRFTIRVVTNLSRLNSSLDSQSRVINAQVIVEPASGISSSSLGGVLDWEVMLLGGLLGLVRLRRKDGEK